MALEPSEWWITPSDWENNIGHDRQFGDDESDRDDICFKTKTKGEGKENTILLRRSADKRIVGISYAPSRL
jgi:hypothetical protein